MSAPTVVILAAGQGTRMRSARPKMLHELCGLPMVLWPVRAARAAGAARTIVVDSPERALEPLLGAGVELAVQERPDGTGGAARAAIEHLRQAAGMEEGEDPQAPVVVLAGDVPLVGAEVISRLVSEHEAAEAMATVATTVLEDPSGYGRIVRDGDGGLLRIVETKRHGDSTQAEREIKEVNTGIFVFARQALADVLPLLSTENAQGELYLPEVLMHMRQQGARVRALEIADERLVLGVNDRAALARVRALAQAAIHERHMLAGVTIVDPHATVIDIDVQIGEDTLIEPFTAIRGSTSIGRECTVRQSYLLDCVLEDGVSVGPFAYVRPGSVLRSGSRLGTFVEVKNSDIGSGARVPHLSYIGDADVGEETNLGASTITANYDGRAKHRTTIGRGVRTGVDTTLVAPVSVGDGAYTAAGSVIVEDVPEGALGVARERQSNVEGYAKRQEKQEPDRRPGAG